MKLLACLASLCLFSVPAFAGEGNTFFNPTPDDQMRAMTTERPSKTDSPFSLDAGHVQIETNLFAYRGMPIERIAARENVSSSHIHKYIDASFTDRCI